MHLDLLTPALLLDRAVLERNLAAMAAKARSLGVRLRPHIKTHKCLEIAWLQRAAGAEGITVATLAEARSFADSGFDDITHAFPLDQGKIGPALKLARELALRRSSGQALRQSSGQALRRSPGQALRQSSGQALRQSSGQGLRLTLDDLAVAQALEQAAADRDQEVHVWLKVDCGYHRAGMDPDSVAAFELVRYLHNAPHLTFDGLLTHAGHGYKAASRQEMRAIAAQERDVMTEFATRLRAANLAVPTVSIGSTPTLSVEQDLPGIDEIRPGNYVFYDRTQAALGSCQLTDCAVTVLTTVVSHQPGRHQVVVDAGALALSHDPGPVHLDEQPVKGVVLTDAAHLTVHPTLRVVALSQEHGIIQGAGATDLEGLEVGTQLRILPNHACLTAALFDEYKVVQGGQVVDRWKIQRQRD